MSECKCKSYNQPQPWQEDEEDILVPPEWLSDRTICIDHCISETIKFLWDNDVRTLSCCCGHGVKNPSVVIGENESNEKVSKLIARVDRRNWNVLKWELVDRHEESKQYRQDLKSVVNMLEGDTERRKVVNYIEEYLLNGN